ncbi:MAG: hypothetical protein MK008_00775 [Bdellovibrionales bacterium]|nr:hypothetical protein [Bdellovibrionales bacterium]
MKYKILILTFLFLPTSALANGQCKDIFVSKSRFAALKTPLNWLSRSKKASLNSSYFKNIKELATFGTPLEFRAYPEKGFESNHWKPNAEKVEALLKNSEYTPQQKLQEITGDYFAFRFQNIKPKKAEKIQAEIQTIMRGKQNVSPGLNIVLKSLNKLMRVKTQLGFKGVESSVASESIGEILKVFHLSQAMRAKNPNLNFLQYSSVRATEALMVFINMSQFGSKLMMERQISKAIKDTVDFTRQLPKEVLEAISAELDAKMQRSELNNRSEVSMHLFLKQIISDAMSEHSINYSKYNGLINKPAFSNMMTRFILMNNFLLNFYIAYSNPIYDPTIIGFDVSAIYWALGLLL